MSRRRIAPEHHRSGYRGGFEGHLRSLEIGRPEIDPSPLDVGALRVVHVDQRVQELVRQIADLHFVLSESYGP